MLASTGRAGEGEGVPDAAATAFDNGAAKEFLTRVNKELTRVYDDWSCSSSSENGLKLVRLVTSSTTLVELLLDFTAP